MDAQTIIAKRIAQELSEGMLVNLGIGIPTLVSKFVPTGMTVYFQSENGLIGTGAPPPEGMHHPLLTDAGGQPVSALPGAMLWCAFGNAPLRAEIDALLASDPELCARVRLLGHVPHAEMEWLYRAADAFVSASRCSVRSRGNQAGRR